MVVQLSADHKVYATFPIVKMEERPEGLVVYGRATNGSVDSDDQIVDPVWSAKALQRWLSTGGNVRVQHNPQLYPAGKGLSVEVDRDGDGGHWVKSLIVEPNAQNLVRHGVLRAYSVGISKPVIRRDTTGKARGGIITGSDETEIAELSLVDRPANASCGVSLVKSAGDSTAWTYGDLNAALADAMAAEAVTKGKKKSKAVAPTTTDPAPAAASGAPATADDSDDDVNDQAPDPDDDDADDDSGGASDSGDGSDDSDDPDDDATKAYAAAVEVHKAAEPKRDTIAPTGTEFLAKAAAWQKWDAQGDSLGLDGTSAGMATWLAKRAMDPDVGGGVDRDKIPDADHVDPSGRRFPIVSPKDVSDAVSTQSLAEPKIPPRKFKRRLTAIANRKGPAFAANLPDSWSKAAGPDVAKDITTTSPNATGLVPYNLQGQGKPKKRKAMKGAPWQCPDCNTFNKNTAATCAHCGHAQGDNHAPMHQMPATKGAKDCPNCGKVYDADAKIRRCESCGKKLPKGDIVKAKSPMPADVKPAGEHREPDGSAVEALEADAGMPTTPDAVPDKIPASVKAGKKTKKPMPADDTDDDKPFPGAATEFGSKSVSGYQLKRMHDAVCAAYRWSDVAAEYPALKGVSDAIVPGFFTDQVAAAALKGDMGTVAVLAYLAQDADLVAKGAVDPAVMADGRAVLEKSFTDLYPTVSIKPSAPPTPGQFQRPYINAGHAPLSASGKRTSAVPASTHVPDPNDFQRGLITAGHEAGSPSASKGNNLDTPNVSSGAARTYYTNASKEAARNAMQSMHDHIATTYPDMCAMAPSRAVMPPDNGATNVPKPVTPMQVPSGPGNKSAVVEMRKLVKRAEKAASIITDRPDVDEVIAKAVAATDAKHAKVAKKNQKLISALQAENDRLGAQPDPAQAPLRGVVSKAATSSNAAPVEKVTLLEKMQAARVADQAELVTYLQRQSRSDNPGIAEKAEKALADALADN
jgi:phage head maturation protease